MSENLSWCIFLSFRVLGLDCASEIRFTEVAHLVLTRSYSAGKLTPDVG
jgi:hypothetical protein